LEGTTEVTIYAFIHGGVRVSLIDTPGFDDTNRTDTDVLKDIAGTLTSLYAQQIKLSGIIYLHRITDVRLQGSALKNLSMFKKLCGDDFYPQTVLATTMWENLQGVAVGAGREQELLDRREWWGHMKQRGSTIFRHHDTRDSAIAIVDYIVGLRKKGALDIQKEMVDQHKNLDQTLAGQETQKELIEANKRHEREIRQLEEQKNDALRDKDLELVEILREEAETKQQIMVENQKAQEQLRIDLQHLLQESEAKYQRQLQVLQEQNSLLMQQGESHQKRMEQRIEEEQRRHQEEREAERRRYAEERDRARIREAEREEQMRSQMQLIQRRSEAQKEHHEAMIRQVSELRTQISDVASLSTSRASVQEWESPPASPPLSPLPHNGDDNYDSDFSYVGTPPRAASPPVSNSGDFNPALGLLGALAGVALGPVGVLLGGTIGLIAGNARR
jgi:hypothetical protein